MLFGLLECFSVCSKDVVVCSWDPTGQMFVSGDRSKKAVLWSR